MGSMCFTLILFWALIHPACFANELKSEAFKQVENQKGELIQLSAQIWEYAEIALLEKQSSKALADYLEQNGFQVDRGVADMPTAFVASYGEGKPIIGIIGEFDALPGLSQKVSPNKEALQTGAAGHGCGHNLFGSASAGAAVAVKRLIEKGSIQGTIRFYGTPAEENIGGKIYMIRAGLFDDLDVCLAWHPSSETMADTDGSLAMVSVGVEFFGRTAHGAIDPWNGRSALDAAELFTHGLNLMREHVKPSVRMHYVYENGGNVPNVVPDYAKVWCFLRDYTHTGVDDLLKRAGKIAEGAALMAEVEVQFTIQTGYYEMLVNEAGAKLLYENLSRLEPIPYTEDELEFAKQLHASLGMESKGILSELKPLALPPPNPTGGSTDKGDLSWEVPLLHLSITTAPADIPWHSWAVVASSGMSIGHKGMIHAAKALAASAIDLFVNDEIRGRIVDEFKKKTEGTEYRSYLPPGPPPAQGK